jgi:hypothetical protein
LEKRAKSYDPLLHLTFLYGRNPRRGRRNEEVETAKIFLLRLKAFKSERSDRRVNKLGK